MRDCCVEVTLLLERDPELQVCRCERRRQSHGNKEMFDGTVDLAEGIAVSCNVYFGQLGLALGYWLLRARFSKPASTPHPNPLPSRGDRVSGGHNCCAIYLYVGMCRSASGRRLGVISLSTESLPCTVESRSVLLLPCA